MADYLAGDRDLRFQLFEWLELERLLAEEPFADWDRESVEMALREALEIARERLAPGHEEGDRVGARWADGEVRLPASFHGGYATVAEGGWVGAPSPVEHGGLGLPLTVASAVTEIFAGANLALTLVFLLTRGVGELIQEHGSPELQRLYCEPLITGRWTGTMCLTEPQAGSDVGASRATAEPLPDGRYAIRGEKIYITFGEHDLTENIVHAVLARLPGAPPGSRGLSLFIIPKLLLDAEGRPGERNDVVCASIEEKLGIHGSPTCSMLFGSQGRCVGHLLGEPHSGLPLMFELMNAARVEVGVQGLAVAAAAHAAAHAYAAERVQGRHWTRAGDRDAEPVAIVEHPDVRRMLFTSDAYVQGMRSLLLRTAMAVDWSRTAADAEERARWAGVAEVLTPIAKAWPSDWGFRVTEWCLQVFGGYGYIRDYPAEQYLRDAKITSIYEGTNGIQALDLVGRKLRRHPEAVRRLLAEAGATAAELGADPELGAAAGRLGEALAALESALAALAGERGPLLAVLNAVPVLDMTGHVLAGEALLRQAARARERLAALPPAEREGGSAEAVFLRNKVRAATHFAHRALPLVRALAAPVLAGETAAVEAEL
ncbi:MAG: acyl-CoA dehydrogenase [Thermoanaerobaculia bacterium]|nr:acyl-CoA dehydrogenase [Thermoanaerobaculia bacterium]